MSEIKRTLDRLVTDCHNHSLKGDSMDRILAEIEATELEIQSLLKAKLSELLEKLPDKKVGTPKIPLNEIERGFNVAVEDCTEVINQALEELR